MTKLLYGNSGKSFLDYENIIEKKYLPAFFPREFFHTVFLVQFEINLHLWVFQKAEIALAKVARVQLFEKLTRAN